MRPFKTVIENSESYFFNTYRFKYVALGYFDDDIDYIVKEGNGNYAFAKSFGIKDINLRWSYNGLLSTFEICFNDSDTFFKNLEKWRQTLIGKITDEYVIERKLVQFYKIDSRFYDVSSTPIIQVNPKHSHRFVLKDIWVHQNKDQIRGVFETHNDFLFPNKGFSDWLSNSHKVKPSICYFDINDIECSTLLIFMFPPHSIQRIQQIIKRKN